MNVNLRACINIDSPTFNANHLHFEMIPQLTAFNAFVAMLNLYVAMDSFLETKELEHATPMYCGFIRSYEKLAFYSSIFIVLERKVVVTISIIPIDKCVLLFRVT